ncbi:response regulator transcription factor [Granulicatella seriolae]|uniref:DNA-binding response regulator n=1 Tax=Granulicatella seriolae TaxID=2967226 RepID=A0ABT1WQA7_9LACT|nr:DNA-binding response regulator [Granulicatella seriolae]
MTYPIIICEDMKDQLNTIVTLIKYYMMGHDEPFKLALATQSPEDAQRYLQEFEPKQGIYFLDIDLNHQIDGIALAQQIRKQDVQAKIIFTSSHEEMIPLTLKRRLEALGFVTKTTDLDAFRSEIFELLNLAQERIDHLTTEQKKAFIFSIGTQVFTINIDDILLLETSDTPHKLVLYTRDGLYEFYGNLRDYVKAYPNLFLLNRSCLIQPKNIIKVDFKTREVHLRPKLSRYFPFGKGSTLRKVQENLKRTIIGQES